MFFGIPGLAQYVFDGFLWPLAIILRLEMAAALWLIPKISQVVNVLIDCPTTQVFESSFFTWIVVWN